MTPRTIRPGVCAICTHKDRARIELLRVGGVSLKALARQFDISKDSVWRHFRTHVSDRRKAELLAGPARVEQLANAAADESRSLLEQLQIVRSVLLNQFLNAAEAGDRAGVANVAGRLLESLREFGRLTGELSSRASPTRSNTTGLRSRARSNCRRPATGRRSSILAVVALAKRAPAAEWVRSLAETASVGRIALVGPTAADARDTMVEGKSGLMAICPNSNRPRYEPSKRRLTWPNGVQATLFSSEEPERLRGPQFGAAWCDELCAWRNVRTTWDNLQFGLRLGKKPRQFISTTPKPLKLLKEIIADPNTVVRRGTTYDNRENLANRSSRKLSGDTRARGSVGRSSTRSCSRTCKARCGAANSSSRPARRVTNSRRCGGSLWRLIRRFRPGERR